jgi:hypothetical protein
VVEGELLQSTSRGGRQRGRREPRRRRGEAQGASFTELVGRPRLTAAFGIDRSSHYFISVPQQAVTDTVRVRNPAAGVKGPGPVDDLLVGHTGTRIPGGSFSVSTPPASGVRHSSVVASTSPDPRGRGTGNAPLGQCAFMASGWGIGSVNVTL